MMLLLLSLLGCTNQSELDQTCDEMCKELVETCAFSAFPSYDSCMQGCAYQDDQGGNIDGEDKCVLHASCDEAAIIDCEHQFGVEGSG